MKNKKLFAILTLVCFMFTLMPVAAFAADTATVTLNNGSVVVKVSDDDTVNGGDVSITVDGTEVAAAAAWTGVGTKEAKAVFTATQVAAWTAGDLVVKVDTVEVAKSNSPTLTWLKLMLQVLLFTIQNPLLLL